MLKAPLVVGYKGEIGRFILASLLEDMPKANDILCVDVNNSEEDVVERIEKADGIFLCVPLQTTSEWLERYGSRLGEKLVIEQSSVKTFLYENPKFAAVRFLSMHLLFRPSATPIEDRRALFFSDRVDGSEVERFAAAAERAFRTRVQVLHAEGDRPAYVRHDQLMARHQALVHRVILSLADSLEDKGARTFVGQRVVELAERIRKGDPTLYQMIQDNPWLESEIAELDARMHALRIDW